MLSQIQGHLKVSSSRGLAFLEYREQKNRWRADGTGTTGFPRTPSFPTPKKSDRGARAPAAPASPPGPALGKARAAAILPSTGVLGTEGAQTGVSRGRPGARPARR